MTAESHPGIEGLPATLPIFPLPGALLLPRGRLPLNVFEPRYLNMVSDALGRGRVIGIIQPSEPTGQPVSDSARLYGTGCVGRIVAFAETEDGRFLITLAGMVRFRSAREISPLHGYRRVSADYAPFRDDLDEDTGRLPDRVAFLDLVRQYFQARRIDADWKALENATDEALVTSLAMICPFAAGEKQALLEASGLANRGDVLTTLLEIDGRESMGSASSAPH